MRFVQPDCIFYFAAKAVLLETARSGRNILGGQKQVKVLGRAPDAGVNLKGESAGDDIRDATAIQDHQCFPKHLLLFQREFRRQRRTDRKFDRLGHGQSWM